MNIILYGKLWKVKSIRIIDVSKIYESLKYVFMHFPGSVQSIRSNGLGIR